MLQDTHGSWLGRRHWERLDFKEIVKIIYSNDIEKIFSMKSTVRSRYTLALLNRLLANRRRKM